MSGTSNVAIQNAALKTPATAERQWAEYAGGYIVAAHWLTGGLLVAIAVIAVLGWSLVQTQRHYAQWKPLVMREYADGRVDVLSYDQATFRATETLVQHFLSRFVELHFTRQSRTALERDYTNSLKFLEPRLQHVPIGADDTTDALQGFIRDRSAKEIETVAKKVTLEDVRQAGTGADTRIVGGKASIDFMKAYIEPNNTNARTTKTFTAQVVFEVLADVPNHFIPVNPIGLQITHIHVDESFE